MKSFIRFTAIIFLVIFTTFSCKKDINNNTPGFQDQTPNLTAKVNASVSGFVTGMNDMPVGGASVKFGTATTTTDNYGYFEFKHVMAVKEAAVVTVESSGYFKSIKTFKVTDGKAGFFRIKLLQKTIAGIIQSASGGSVSLPGGLRITLPADAVKTVSTGAQYSGPVNVAVQWIDPTSAELDKIMPGDLRGINTDGFIKGLTTYGMTAVELSGSGGELLQIAAGKKADISFPLPSSIAATAPATIPLWYFEENTGLWKEEGIATKTGNNYVGQVAHFSFWNCDVPSNYIEFSCKILDQENNPLSFVPVKISLISNPFVSRIGYTDGTGFATGLIPINEQLKLEVLSSFNCGVLYTRNFNTGITNYTLGNINIPNTTISLASVTGSITDCNNAPVTNGFLLMKVNNQYTRYQLNGNGTYNFSTFICNNPTTCSFFGVDITGVQQSATFDTMLVAGSNTINNIQACGLVPVIYDGKYNMSGYHNRVPYDFPYVDVPMELRTTGPNAVAFYWPERDDFGHPFGVGVNTLNWYGNTMSPVIVFNPANNEVTDVYNIGSGGPPISIFAGSNPVTYNYYDPLTRKIYVAWNYNANPNRVFFDTLTYTGPR